MSFLQNSSYLPHAAEENLELAKREFAPPAQLSDAEIAQVLGKLPELKRWASDVESYALSLAVNQGKTWAGFKLVEGRSIRKYVDETKVVETAQAAGINDIFERKLKTITALEKQLGKLRYLRRKRRCHCCSWREAGCTRRFG